MIDVTVERVFAQLSEKVVSRLELTHRRQLLERILAVLIEDKRFLGEWLWCSFSRGEADGQSDLDLYLVVDDRDISFWWKRPYPGDIMRLNLECIKNLLASGQIIKLGLADVHFDVRAGRVRVLHEGYSPVAR
jgi:hypothetical protein